MIKNLNLKISIIGLVMVALFAFILFDWTGVRTVLGMLAVFFLPFYLILDNFDLQKDEKIFFSFFIGLAFYPVFVFYINRIIPSMRASMLVTFIFLIATGIVLRYKKSKKVEAKTS